MKRKVTETCVKFCTAATTNSSFTLNSTVAFGIKHILEDAATCALSVNAIFNILFLIPCFCCIYLDTIMTNFLSGPTFKTTFLDVVNEAFSVLALN